ncbi:MAG: ATP-dependent helicase, partial [Bilophila sp.]
MPQQKDVYTLFLQYRDILPLVGCVLAESLAHLTPNAEPYTTFIFEQKPEILFLSFLGDRESWERLFDTIEHVLCPKGTPETSTAKLRKKRLVWLLDPENFELEPLEQTSKQTKAGEDWSSGRVASLKRLFEQYRTLDWLTEQDRQILDTLELENTWNGMCCRFDIHNALCELAGHPLLFEKGTRRPLTLRCQPVELVVRQKGAGYVLSLSPVADFGSLLVKEAPDAYCLYLLPEKLG